MDGKPTLTSVINKNRKVFVFGKNLKEWAKGVTIICRRCGNVEIVNEDSLLTYGSSAQTVQERTLKRDD